MQADGIHPNPEGVKLIVEGLGPKVLELAGAGGRLGRRRLPGRSSMSSSLLARCADEETKSNEEHTPVRRISGPGSG